MRDMGKIPSQSIESRFLSFPHARSAAPDKRAHGARSRDSFPERTGVIQPDFQRQKSCHKKGDHKHIFNVSISTDKHRCEVVFRLPRKMNWVESLFSRLPVGREKPKEQILVRLAFLFLIWSTGLVAYALDGMTAEYVSNVQFYSTLFGTSLIVLFGSYMVQRSLGNIILSFRSLLKLDDSSFREFSDRVERYSYSFVPCILIALLLTVFFSVAGWQLSDLQAVLGSIHATWNLLLVFFLNLLTATGVWIGVSIWLTIFLISQQPLQVKPSPNTIEEFRGLTMLALWFSLFYFIAISIGIVVPLARQPAMSLLDIFFLPCSSSSQLAS